MPSTPSPRPAYLAARHKRRPDALLADVQAFCAGWTSHGRPVEARAAVLAGRVLAVAARITEADVERGVSGCGIDAMQHAAEGRPRATAASFFPPSR